VIHYLGRSEEGVEGEEGGGVSIWTHPCFETLERRKTTNKQRINRGE